MTTRRSFIAGLLATAAAGPTLAAAKSGTLEWKDAFTVANSNYTQALAASFRQIKEIWAANHFNYGTISEHWPGLFGASEVVASEGGWFLDKNTDEMVSWSRSIDTSEWLVSEGT